MEAKLTKFRGCSALTGGHIDRLALQDRSRVPKKTTTPYHITLITKDEARDLAIDTEAFLRKVPEIELAIDLGLGKCRDVFYRVIFWLQGDLLRKQLGLPPKQFHITLSSANDHLVDKGVKSIVEPAALTSEQIECVVQTCLKSATGVSSRSSTLDMVRFVADHHMADLTDKTFDGVWRLLSKFGVGNEASGIALAYLSIHPCSVAANLRAADCCDITNEARRAMHYYGQAASLALQHPGGSDRILSTCAKGMVKCSEHTEFGAFFREDEIEMWEKNSSFFCQTGKAFDNSALRKLVRDEVAASMASEDLDSRLPHLLSLPSNIRVLAVVRDKLYKMPRFFRWLLPFRLAVMSTPRNKEDIEALAAHKVTLVTTLTEEEPLPVEWFANTPCRNIFIPVHNYHPPSILQVDQFIKLMDDLPEDEAALIHCGGGKGRAGTLAACYLMARGFKGKPNAREDLEAPIHIFPADVIRVLRNLRPGSIETVDQENFIKQYAKHITRQGHTTGCATNLVQQVPELQHPLELSGHLPSKPSLIVCCGIPGSGKSTVSGLLAKHLGYAVISQDELGSRSACLSALGNALQTGSRILIDRCNPYVEDREEWLAHAFHPDDALCVWFDIDREVCIQRADARADHPTVAQGRARKIVMSFSKTFVRPSLKENFACIARVPSSSAASDLLLRFGVPRSQVFEIQTAPTATPPSPDNTSSAQVLPTTSEKPFIYKFPRTRHLFNLGAASRDDLILASDDANAFLNPMDPSITIVLEEKVDDANLGITADGDSPSGFKVQNRSHYVTSKSHAQFKKLDKWLDDHRQELDAVLRGENGGYPAGKFILYGEWLYAKHSINYDNLPDIFLAFDLFDTDSNTFLGRQEITQRLAATNIHQVNSIPAPERLDEQSLLDLARTRHSVYYDGLIEGLYLRKQQNGRTVDRAKIVRSDFIAGDEHWSRGNVVLNRTVKGSFT